MASLNLLPQKFDVYPRSKAHLKDLAYDWAINLSHNIGLSEIKQLLIRVKI